MFKTASAKETAALSVYRDKKEEGIRMIKPSIVQSRNKVSVSCLLNDSFISSLETKAIVVVLVAYTPLYVKKMVSFCWLFYLLFRFMHQKKRFLSRE